MKNVSLKQKQNKKKEKQLKHFELHSTANCYYYSFA